MRDELKAHTRWARHDGGTRWTLGLTTPAPPALMGWLVATYEVGNVQALETGTVALGLRADRKTVAALMELPKVKGTGSRHESNQVAW
ncbi:MAG: hypothetical protein HC878_03620 [Leptolyngbyaceae cyanobacterium SL_5_14]|nr:hypothetical protein [Leptolyngbyaceae cyanobacterium SL_5_14]NJO66148.1 hypothetical protein [Leptolyngbyaceae cyanobacterium RM1_405_57]